MGVDYSTWGSEGDLVSKVLNRNLQKTQNNNNKKPQTSKQRHSRKGGAKMKYFHPLTRHQKSQISKFSSINDLYLFGLNKYNIKHAGNISQVTKNYIMYLQGRTKTIPCNHLNIFDEC